MHLRILFRSSVVCHLILGVLVLLSFGSCNDQDRRNRSVIFAAALLPSEQQKLDQILNTFTDRTGIEVELVAQQYQQIREVLEAESKAGQGELDLIEIDVHLLPQVSEFVRSLEDQLTGLDSLSAQISGEVWEAGLQKGEQKFLPHRLNWQALVYNSDVINKPPDTWEDLLELGRRNPGAIGFKGARYEGMVCDFFPFLWQAGADPLNPGSPECLVALKFLEELAPFLNRSTRTFKENTILQAQEHQEILLHLNWPFVVPLLEEKGLLPQRIRTAPIPAGPRGRATVLGGAYLAIPKTSDHAPEAARLLEFLLSPETQQLLTKELGWFPIRGEELGSPGEEERMMYEGFLSMKQHIRARPSVPYYNELSRLWQDALARLLYEQVNAETIAAEMTRSVAILQKATTK